MERDFWLEQAMAQWEVPLLRTCYLLLGDAALSEDALQETFIRAWKGYGSFRGESSEKTWLMRIAVNVCRDLRRSRWFRHVDRRVRMEDLPEPAVPFEKEDDTLTRAILSLPHSLRQVITLRYGLGGCTPQRQREVAKILNISRSYVSRIEKKALQKLRRELSETMEP